MIYVSFGFKVRHIHVGCVAMGSVVLFILRCNVLYYSAEYRVNIMQVVLSGFSVRLVLFCQS